MGPKCGHSQSSVHSLDATEGMAAFWNGICAKCPTCQSCNCFSCHRSSTKRYIWNMRCEIWNMRARGSHAALHHHTGHWPGSSCRILAWHRFRGFCAKQTGLLRLPLRSRLREGIVWFMRWEEKIKLPRCLSSGWRGRRVLLCLVAQECSLHIAFKGRKGSVEAECSASGRALSQIWVTLSQAVQQNWSKGSTSRCNPRSIGQRPHSARGGCASSILSVVSCASQWGALFDGKSEMFAWPKMNFRALNSPISHDKKWGCELKPSIYFHISVLTANQKNNHTHNEVLSPTCFSHEWDCIFLVTGPGNFFNILF